MGLADGESAGAVLHDRDDGDIVSPEEEQEVALWEALFQLLIERHGTIGAAARTTVFLGQLLEHGPTIEKVNAKVWLSS